MIVINDFPGVHRHAQPYSLFGGMRDVVPRQPGRQGIREHLDEWRLRKMRWCEHEDPVATVLVMTFRPGRARYLETLRQGAVQRFADDKLMRRCPALIGECLDIHDDNRPMYRLLTALHLVPVPSRRSCSMRTTPIPCREGTTDGLPDDRE
ncbi:hypothetical protein [Amycolatopsis sp. NPDC052450]|uniref:hypothetical protein n=1 Tax=Amycolatopsis sp. NPDC052450 TaxID=3363937 RepID=UPI0037CC01B4